MKPKRVHPAGTGYVNKLYEMKGLGEGLKDQFERLFLKPVDSKAADALSIIEDDASKRVWNGEQRSAWTRFILTLLMRMPEDIAHLKKLTAAQWNKSDPEVDAQYLAVKSDADPPH